LADLEIYYEGFRKGKNGGKKTKREYKEYVVIALRIKL